ncbi:MAG: hypothetical protein ABH828_04325 [archaeon]
MSIDNVVNERKTRLKPVLSKTVSTKFNKYFRLEDFFVTKQDLARFLSMKLEEEFDMSIKPSSILDMYVWENYETAPGEISRLLSDLIKNKDSHWKTFNKEKDFKYLGRRVGSSYAINILEDIKKTIKTNHNRIIKNKRLFYEFIANNSTLTVSILNNITSNKTSKSFQKSISSGNYKSLFHLKTLVKINRVKPRNKYFMKIDKDGFGPKAEFKDAREVIENIKQAILNQYEQNPLSYHHLFKFLSEKTGLAVRTINDYHNLNGSIDIKNFRKLRDFKELLENEIIDIPKKYFYREVTLEQARNEIAEAIKEIDFLSNKSAYEYLGKRINRSEETIKRFFFDGKRMSSDALEQVFDEARAVRKRYEKKDLDGLIPYLTATYKVSNKIISNLMFLKRDLYQMTIAQISQEVASKISLDLTARTIKDYCYKTKKKGEREVFNVLIDSINKKIPFDKNTKMVTLLKNYYKILLNDESGLLLEYAVNNLVSQNNFPSNHFAEKLNKIKNLKPYNTTQPYELGDFIFHPEFGYGHIKIVYGTPEMNNQKIKVRFSEEVEKKFISGRKEITRTDPN